MSLGLVETNELRPHDLSMPALTMWGTRGAFLRESTPEALGQLLRVIVQSPSAEIVMIFVPVGTAFLPEYGPMMLINVPVRYR